MRKKGEKFASRVRPWFLLSRAPILNDICLSILNRHSNDSLSFVNVRSVKHDESKLFEKAS